MNSTGVCKDIHNGSEKSKSRKILKLKASLVPFWRNDCQTVPRFPFRSARPDNPPTQTSHSINESMRLHLQPLRATSDKRFAYRYPYRVRVALPLPVSAATPSATRSQPLIERPTLDLVANLDHRQRASPRAARRAAQEAPPL